MKRYYLRCTQCHHRTEISEEYGRELAAAYRSARTVAVSCSACGGVVECESEDALQFLRNAVHTGDRVTYHLKDYVVLDSSQDSYSAYYVYSAILAGEVNIAHAMAEVLSGATFNDGQSTLVMESDGDAVKVTANDFALTLLLEEALGVELKFTLVVNAE